MRSELRLNIKSWKNILKCEAQNTWCEILSKQHVIWTCQHVLLTHLKYKIMFNVKMKNLTSMLSASLTNSINIAYRLGFTIIKMIYFIKSTFFLKDKTIVWKVTIVDRMQEDVIFEVVNHQIYYPSLCSCFREMSTICCFFMGKC